MAHDPATTARISPPSYLPSWEPPSLFPRTDGEAAVWQQDAPEWPHGACLTCSTSAPLNGADASLSLLLEPGDAILPKFFLSPRASAGILHRATKRGKALPVPLQAALAESIAP